MTTPSLYKSFDTSLIDVNRSFSSTESATSEGSSAKENQPPIPAKDNAPGRIIEDVGTRDLYEAWAATYDNDGNFLQAVDDIEVRSTLPKISELVKDARTLRILDLGCGTGRTTMKLLQNSWSWEEVEVEGWDASAAMLELARAKCRLSTGKTASVIFRQVDLLDLHALPTGSEGTFDLAVSTLVLEHFPVTDFFGLVCALLRPGGVAFVSNMHPDMGAKSVAGYDDAQGTRKVGKSYIHGVKESVEAANDSKLEVLEVREVGMRDEWIKDGLVSERGRKWVGMNVWFGMVVRKM